MLGVIVLAGKRGVGEMKRCMFVDDSSVIRKVAKRILGGPDMLVIEASSGPEALEMCAADMPDIVVVDGTLEDMQAEEFIRNVRTLKTAITPQILISLIEVDIGAIMRAKRAGAQGYLLKPFNRSQLIERFRMLNAA
jgi:two-component system chemotaxis response regulator CheY